MLGEYQKEKYQDDDEPRLVVVRSVGPLDLRWLSRDGTGALRHPATKGLGPFGPGLFAVERFWKLFAPALAKITR